MSDATLIEVGAPFSPDTQGAGFVTFVLDAATDILEWIFQAPAAITITRLGFRYGLRTGTPPTYRISLQGVDADGLPNGVIKGATNNALKTFTPPADTTWNSTWQWQTLVESYTCTRGEWLAIVIDYSAGTIDGTNNSTFTSVFSSGAGRTGHPYAIQNNAGVRTRQVENPVYGYASATVTYGCPVEAMTFTGFSSGSTPNEYGLTFNLPAAWGATYQVVGIKWFGQTANSTGDSCTISLYDADGDPGTVLQSIVYDWDMNATPGSAGGNTRNNTIYFDEATLASLNFGTTYHVGIRADQVSVGMTVTVMNLDAAADRAAWPGGENFNACTRAGGVWTEDTAARPLIALILADWTEPAGGGGLRLAGHGGLAA